MMKAPPARPTRPAHQTATWAVILTGLALFMTSLDNLVVTFALPVIRERLHTGLAGLEWTVNAYTLAFAVLLPTGAALGDRFGRRRLFLLGLGVFTAASAAAALAPSITWLVAARAVQGAGAAVVMPLTLTLLTASVPAARRGAALGIWGAIGGAAVAIGPLVGGAVVQGISWQWIFWLNVPVGLVVLAIARGRLEESRGERRPLDLPGVALVTAGLFGVVLGLVEGPTHGWASPLVGSALAGGVASLIAFVAWERRAPAPMIPPRLFRRPGFAAVNLASLLMGFGMFGSIFLLSQFLQTVQRLSPLEAGVRTLLWTAMPVLLAAPIGRLADRIGGRPLLVTGLACQAVGLLWLAVVSTPTVGYPEVMGAFAISGVGMSLFFVPVAQVVMGTVRPQEQGIASGTNNTLREVGGVLGIAVMGTIFSSLGGYATGATFVAGLRPALLAGAVLLALASLSGLAIPGRRRMASGVAASDAQGEDGVPGPAAA